MVVASLGCVAILRMNKWFPTCKSHWKVQFLCALYMPGEWLWVDSNGTDGKPTFHRRANLSWLSAICIHFREIAAWNRKSLTMFTYLVTFLEKNPYWQIFKNVLRKNSCGRGSTSCVQISWNLADRKSVKSRVAHQTKKRISARSPALASAQIAPKISQGQLRTIFSRCSKFHTNPLTSGGVRVGRVNVVETCHKMFPILGEASSPSNDYRFQCISRPTTLGLLNVTYFELNNFTQTNFPYTHWTRKPSLNVAPTTL